MSQIILDADTASKLSDLDYSVELCDPSGRVLGYFSPRVEMSEVEFLSPGVSEEELDRREQSDKWYSFEEVMAHLKRLEEQ